MTATSHYRRPGALTRRLMNPLVMLAMRAGVSLLGSRTLEVPGRKSGVVRRTPVNLLGFENKEYLVAARGETDWVRNVRAAGGAVELVLGRHHAKRRAEELDDADKVPLLRAYLKRWKAEVGIFFDGVGPDSSDEEIARIAPRHPVFVLSKTDR